MPLDRSASPLSVTVMHTPDEFARVRDDWDALVRAMPRPSPFLLHGWLEQWWRHHAALGTGFAVVARRDGALVGAIPVFVRRRRALKILEFMGGSQSALADLLLAPGEDPSLLRPLADAAFALPCDLVDLFGLPGQSRLIQILGDSRLDLVQRVEAPVLDLSTGWDAVYRSKTTSKKRNLHSRRRRQLAGIGRVSVTVSREGDALRTALEEAFHLHSLRWNGRPDGSGFATPLGKEFHRAAICELEKLDIPRIVTLRIDDKPVAFHYYFALNGTMYVHRLAFHPDYARYSPGQINTLDTIQAAAEEGLTKVEFLGGGERYKVELADRFDPLFEAIGLARTVQGHAVTSARKALIRTRLTLKQSPRARRFYFETLAPVRRAVHRQKT